MKQFNGFLGDTLYAARSADMYIALNRYGADRTFEEWHSHEHSSISFLLGGGHREELSGKTFDRRPGDIKFIPAGEMHRCNHYQEQTRKINIELPMTLLWSTGSKEDDVARLIADHPRTRSVLLKFYRELVQAPYDQHNASWQLLLLDLLQPADQTAKSPPFWISQLKDLLYERCAEQLELSEIARLLDVHPVTISRYFPQYFGETLSAYLREVRVAKALGLIKNTTRSLTEIGLACGFSDQSHFTHSFKSVTGMLPSAYRLL